MARDLSGDVAVLRTFLYRAAGRMMTMSVALAACGGTTTPASPTVANEKPASLIDPYCPPVPTLGPWRFEVFPGCPPAPFEVAMHVCDGECGKPCAYEGHTGRDMAIDALDWYHPVSYDAQGRFARETGEEETHNDFTCTYHARGRLAACQWFTQPMKAVRDERGRLTAIIEPRGTHTIKYDAAGRVSAIDESTFAYDDKGLLASFEIKDAGHSYRDSAYTLERDATGRVIRETGRRYERTFEYDAANRVTRTTDQVPFARLRAMYPVPDPNAPPPPDKPDAITAAGKSFGPNEMELTAEIDLGAELADDAGPKTDAEVREIVEQSKRLETYSYDERGRFTVVKFGEGIDVNLRAYHYRCDK